jgi:hypothetical protein
MNNLTKQERHDFFKFAGLIAGLFSKFLLEGEGFVINYTINGENISDIQNLEVMDISERIKLAVAEERYEDAARLKRLLDSKLISHDGNGEI